MEHPAIDLLNTVWADHEGVHDALAAGAAPGLRELRDAARRLAATATADPRTAWTSPVESDEAAAAILNLAAASAPRWSQLALPDRRTTQVAGTTEDAQLAELAEQSIALFGGEQRARLRACLAPGCVLYFLAQQPRREWCSDACGNRARVARHYRRHRG